MKRSLQLVGLLLVAMALPTSADAKSLTPDEALGRALSQPASSMMKKKATKEKTVLAHTFNISEADATPMVYVFNKGSRDGYVIAPADDRFPAILGYSDNGSFDFEKMPASMKWFIEGYVGEMEYLMSRGESAAMISRMNNDWEPVEPLLKSKWDQGDPYNMYSPKLELTNGDSYETVTGCVATSMAQVMYYHKWPDVGVGSHAYEWQPFSNAVAKKLSCDFSKTVFDWDNMLDTYVKNSETGEAEYTEAQAKAVAELMYACGISVDMTYNIEAQGGSGAVSRQQSVALVDNFKYSRSIRYKYRDYCTSQEFEEIIYNNLKEGLPVLYNGRGSAGGHSFVCDGYSGDHYFHFNWGWSGMSDGYFYLCRLDPQDLGAGGGAGGFNTNQGISYNIRPVKDGNDTGVAEQPYLICDGNFAFDTEVEEKSSAGDILVYSRFKVNDGVSGSGIWNMSSAELTGYIGVVLEPKDSPEDKTFYVGIQVNNLSTNRGYQKVLAYLGDVKEEGVYKVYPAYYNAETDEIDIARSVNGYRNYLYMTVGADGKRTFTDSTVEDELATAPELMVTCFNYTGKVLSGIPHNFLVSVANLSPDKDYYGTLTMVLKDSRGRELTTYPLGKYDLPGGMSIPYSFSTNLAIDKQAEFTVSFRDSYGRDLPGEYPLVISGKGEALTTQLRASSYAPVDIKPLSKSPSVSFQVGNYGTTEVSAPITFGVFCFKKGETRGSGWTFTYPNLSIPSGKAYNLTGPELPFNLEEGEYTIRISWEKPSVDADGNPVVGTDGKPVNERIWISHPIDMNVGYPVESLTMSTPSKDIKVGFTEKLDVTFTPANATYRALSWTSSAPTVATVDNDGNVTGVGEGRAYVTAAAHNGAYDVCEVAVGTKTSVDDILGEVSEIVAVYNVSGVKVLDRPSVDEVKELEKGMYVVVTDKGSCKLAK